MEAHILKLESLCRLCGSKIAYTKYYLNAKLVSDFKDEIISQCGLSCWNESKEVYPTKLCSGCVLSLRKGTLKRSPHIFTTHDDDCKICNIYQISGRPLKSADKFNTRKLDELFGNIGFQKFMPKEVGRERVYVKFMDFFPELELSVNCIEKTWSLKLYGRLISIDDINNLDGVFVSEILTNENVAEFAQTMSKLTMCRGNGKYEDVVSNRVTENFNEAFPAQNDGVAAIVESKRHFVPLQAENFTLVRHPDCKFVMMCAENQHMCDLCMSLDKKFRVYQTRLTSPSPPVSSKTTDSSHTNYRYLSNNQLAERLNNSQQKKRQLSLKFARLSRKVHELTMKEGVEVQSDHQALFKDIISKNDSPFEDDSPQWLLWEQQKEYASKKDKRGMRWHPLIIRWCLSLYHTSPAGYKQLTSKNNNFMMLPHINTLRKFTSFTDPKSGFNVDVIKKLIGDNKLENDLQRNVCIVLDERKIKGDLVFNRATGKLVGFTDMGNVNEEIREFSDRCEGKKVEERAFSKYVNVFMVRGLFSGMKAPFGYYASTGMTGDMLYPCVMEATRVLKAIGFKVRSWTCDGASPNRKFFKICQGEKEFWTTNPFDHSRKIYFISDVPHLIKTTRNNLENSHGNNNTRNLHFNGHDISWNHLVSCYEDDLMGNRSCPGLRKLHHLTEEHVKLTPRLRMKVKLAAQVMSSRMANALIAENKFYTRETRKFLFKVDEVFDCLNGMNATDYGKPKRAPYRLANDPRFNDILQDFLKYLKDWEDEVEKIPGLPKEEKAKRMLSNQTRAGWRITINSFTELTKELLQEGASYVLSEKFSQDPLEEHFGRQRRRLGCNENPTYYEFQRNELILDVMRHELITDLRGNTAGRNEKRKPIDIHDLRKLPTKQSLKKN